MDAEWDSLSEELQLTISQAAISQAAGLIAERAEMLAEEFDSGAMSDRGGAEALRLFAELIRISGSDPLKPQGSA